MKINVSVEISPDELSVLLDISHGLQGLEATKSIEDHHEWMATAFDMAEAGLLSIDLLNLDYCLTKIGQSIIDKTLN